MINTVGFFNTENFHLTSHVKSDDDDDDDDDDEIRDGWV